MSLPDLSNCCYFRSYYTQIFTQFSRQCQLNDAKATLQTTKTMSDDDDAVAAAINKQLKQFIIMAWMDAARGVDEQQPCSIMMHTSSVFLQIILFIAIVCLIRQYLNLKIVQHEPVRLVNNSLEYDAYDKLMVLVTSSTPNRRKSIADEAAAAAADTDNEAGGGKQRKFKKKHNTDKFVTNKRKCISVGPVMTNANQHKVADEFKNLLDAKVESGYYNPMPKEIIPMCVYQVIKLHL